MACAYLVLSPGTGALLDERFVLVNHIGRKSGLPRHAVLEVVHHDHETGIFVVASGFGEKSDWYQNVMAHLDISIQVGRTTVLVRAERLPLPKPPRSC